MTHTQKRTSDTQNVGQPTYKVGGNGHVPDTCTPDVRTDPLKRIKDAAYQMRWYSGLDDYPYHGGIEGLKTSLICTLNILGDLIDYIEERSNERD